MRIQVRKTGRKEKKTQQNAGYVSHMYAKLSANGLQSPFCGGIDLDKIVAS